MSSSDVGIRIPPTTISPRYGTRLPPLSALAIAQVKLTRRPSAWSDMHFNVRMDPAVIVARWPEDACSGSGK